jgi:hypothetical protein
VAGIFDDPQSELIGQRTPLGEIHRSTGEIHRNPLFYLDVKPQFAATRLENTGHVVFYVLFVPDFIPGFGFSYGSQPPCQHRLSLPSDYHGMLGNPPPSVRLPHCPVTALTPATARPAPSLSCH